MTITDYASELAARLRTEGVDGPAVREALTVAVALWMDIDRPDPVELQWGLFATQVASVADGLYADSPDVAITVDPAVLGDEQQCRAAARELVDAAAQVLHAAGEVAGQPRGWEYAHAAIALRAALGHLP